MLCHEASPADPALLTLGRATASWRQMAPMVSSSLLPQDGMTEGLFHVGCNEFAVYLNINLILITTPIHLHSLLMCFENRFRKFNISFVQFCLYCRAAAISAQCAP